MKRSFLTALGLEKAVIDQIMEEHGTTIETLKERNTEAMEALKEQVTDLKGQLAEKADNSGNDWKAKYEAEVEAHQSTKTELSEKTEKEVKTAKLQKLHANLKAAGANPDYIELLESKFDVAALEEDGDGFKGWEDTLKPIQAKYSGLFGTVETKGPNVATPPAGNPANYTMDDIKKMSPAEINKNWDKVSKTLEKGV
ncbi:hypothetical protein LJC49_07165 [Ruminococcaceae bacterium OttesenSCG-928-I18]|nr:hypothetical protein [Ruminococcaceae bacterium OttesenSCG-928-I18]